MVGHLSSPLNEVYRAVLSANRFEYKTASPVPVLGQRAFAFIARLTQERLAGFELCLYRLEAEGKEATASDQSYRIAVNNRCTNSDPRYLHDSWCPLPFGSIRFWPITAEEVLTINKKENRVRLVSFWPLPKKCLIKKKNGTSLKCTLNFISFALIYGISRIYKWCL